MSNASSNNLKKAILPPSVKRIGKGAFKNSSSLCQLSNIQLEDTVGVVIPPTVKVIEEENFDLAYKIIVFDNLQEWHFRHSDFHTDSDKNYIAEVYGAEDYRLKYKIWAAFVGETKQVREIFFKLWLPEVGIDFNLYDRVFKLYRHPENKILYTIMRLRYPYKLGKEHKERLLKYYQGHREQSRKFFVKNSNQEALKVMDELDEMFLEVNEAIDFNMEQQ